MAAEQISLFVYYTSRFKVQSEHYGGGPKGWTLVGEEFTDPLDKVNKWFGSTFRGFFRKICCQKNSKQEVYFGIDEYFGPEKTKQEMIDYLSKKYNINLNSGCIIDYTITDTLQP